MADPAGPTVGPAVSVICPAFNAERYLAQAIRTVLDQSYTDFELIVVDDGSTDETLSIARQLAVTDPRISVIEVSPNAGRSNARNLGMAAARGTWLTFVDADDLYMPDRLECLMRTASRHPDAMVVRDDLMGFEVNAGGEVVLFHRFSTRQTIGIHREHTMSNRSWFIDQECSMVPLARRSFIESLGAHFPRSLSAGEDLSFGLQLVFGSSQPVVRTGTIGYLYRQVPSARANQANARRLVMETANEVVRSDELARLAHATQRSRLFIHQRSDRMMEAQNRAARPDAGSPELKGRKQISNPLGGYGRLAFLKLVRLVADVADRGVRPAIAAEIERQLAAPPERPGAS